MGFLPTSSRKPQNFIFNYFVEKIFKCNLPSYSVFNHLRLSFIFILVFNSCNNNPVVVPKNPEFSLTTKDATCLEVWLSLKTDNAYNINLFRNDSLIMKIMTTAGTDTTIYDNQLLPSHEYSYRAELNVENIKYSRETTISTLDTTSHNFTFQSWEFGQHGSSILRDIAIIDENNIWAVGEIYMYDSNGQEDPLAYNAVHWDGLKWEVKKISVLFRNNMITPPLYGICAVSPNEIWLSAGVPIKGDGINWTQYHLFDMGILTQQDGHITDIWGNSSSVYFVGNLGTIAHYNGKTWKRIESGTDVNLKDVWGTPDGNQVWICGTEDFKPTVLLKYQNSLIQTVFNSEKYLFTFSPDELSGGINSLWTNNDHFLYISTWYSLYRKQVNTDYSRTTALRLGDPFTWQGKRSRGSDINNIFTAGNRGTIHHYNGVSFQTYQHSDRITYYGLDFKDNSAAVCGTNFSNGIYDKAIISIIK